MVGSTTAGREKQRWGGVGREGQPITAELGSAVIAGMRGVWCARGPALRGGAGVRG